VGGGDEGSIGDVSLINIFHSQKGDNPGLSSTLVKVRAIFVFSSWKVKLVSIDICSEGPGPCATGPWTWLRFLLFDFPSSSFFM